ncbi:hypothetical protein TIFTF001_024388 [Ficus carica]|uniref:Uncharacterized protein n=1 Tax=Ficus carica TaxID=3494 RepID=A0AA88AGK4_FICCA|nr:hypothetical protein TIFTF001_024388 [Ficus carica]
METFLVLGISKGLEEKSSSESRERLPVPTLRSLFCRRYSDPSKLIITLKSVAGTVSYCFLLTLLSTLYSLLTPKPINQTQRQQQQTRILTPLTVKRS